MIVSSQVRAARAMLSWSRAKLAQKSKVSERTVIDFERDARVPQASTKLAIKLAFEEAGIDFVPAGETSKPAGPGLRLRREQLRSNSRSDFSSLMPKQ